jgi:hypothetical protein
MHGNMHDMCQYCVEIDKQVERYRQLLRSTIDAAEIPLSARLTLYLLTEQAMGCP